jgi:hypothetical protein
MAQLMHTAAFDVADARERMLAELACPACGYRDPDDAYRVRPGNRVRFFCDGCGAFVTIQLSDAQARVVRDWCVAGSSGGPMAGAQDLDRQ